MIRPRPVPTEAQVLYEFHASRDTTTSYPEWGTLAPHVQQQWATILARVTALLARRRAEEAEDETIHTC